MNWITKFINYLIGNNKIDNTYNKDENFRVFIVSKEEEREKNPPKSSIDSSSKAEDPGEAVKTKESKLLMELTRMGGYFYSVKEKNVVFYIHTKHHYQIPFGDYVYPTVDNVKLLEVLWNCGLADRQSSFTLCHPVTPKDILLKSGLYPKLYDLDIEKYTNRPPDKPCPDYIFIISDLYGYLNLEIFYGKSWDDLINHT